MFELLAYTGTMAGTDGVPAAASGVFVAEAADAGVDLQIPPIRTVARWTVP